MAQQLYRVGYGDSLWKISEQTLGNPRRWPEIAQLNHIDNSELIYIGQELQLPPQNPRVDSQLSPFKKYQEPSLSTFLGQYQTTYT